MGKIAAIIVIVAVVAVLAVVYMQSKSKDAEFDLAQVPVDPRIDLREPAPDFVSDTGSEEQALLQDLLPPTATPKDSSPTVTPASDSNSDRERLRAKMKPWKYRTFVQIGTYKSASMENSSTSETLQVTEGYTLGKIKVDQLTREACVVSLGDATMSMPLEAKPEPTAKKESPGPLTYEEQKERFRKYKEDIMPTFQYIYSQYTPLPGQIIRTTPPSKEEVETAVAAYYQTMAPTIEASTKVSLPGGPAVTPDMPGGADRPPSGGTTRSDAEMREFINRQMQGTPAPGPNTSPEQ